MNNNLVDTKNRKNANSELVKEVKKAVGLALEESNWGDNKLKQKQIIIEEQVKLKGDSGLLWMPDLVVTDRNIQDIYSIIFCISTKWPSQKLKNRLTGLWCALKI